MKAKRDRSVRRHHPWLFSGAIQRVIGDADVGDLVAVQSSQGEFLAWGQYSPHSQIRARLVSWAEASRPSDEGFWRGLLTRAVVARLPLLRSPDTDVCRLVNAESDGVPGLIADRYGKALVLQFLTAGAEVNREALTRLLKDAVCRHVEIDTVYERSDADARSREGLPKRTGLLDGEPAPAQAVIRENGLAFEVDITTGHKTGLYLDQRENRDALRRLVRRKLRDGGRVRLLNVFSYTGGFTIYGLEAGAAEAVNVESSSGALAAGTRNISLNGLDTGSVQNRIGDAFEVLRQLRRSGDQFDVIVLDPPKFAFKQRDVQRAARGYKDINMQAFHLLKPGGHLMTFSCSGAVSDDLFQKIVFGAALDARCDAQIVGRLAQADDHPVALTFPESAYLKGLVCRASGP